MNPKALAAALLEKQRAQWLAENKSAIAAMTRNVLATTIAPNPPTR